jgi:hypothetical protein
MMKTYFLIIFMCFYVTNFFGQDPNWNFNLNDYQFNMTFTTALNINGAALSSSNDKVAAFIDGEVRGVAGVTYVASLDKYVSYLTVFSNNAFGETINFKIYDSASDLVTTVSRSAVFQLNAQLGGIFQSFSLANPLLNASAEITSFSFNTVAEKSINISENIIDILVPAGTDLTNLVANFITSSGASVFIDKVQQVPNSIAKNFTNSVTYQVLSEDEATLKEYIVNVAISVIVSDLMVSLTTNANLLVTENPIEIRLTTSEAILPVKQEDFSLTNAAVQSIISLNESTYTINVVAISQGYFSIQVPESKISTSNNKVSNASNKLIFTYDSKEPYLVSILRKSPALATTNENTLEFTATFNEPVDNVLASNFESVLGATLNIKKVNDATYVVTVSNIDAYNGKVSLSLKKNTTITDFSGNPIRTSILKNY